MYKHYKIMKIIAAILMTIIVFKGVEGYSIRIRNNNYLNQYQGVNNK